MMLWQVVNAAGFFHHRLTTPPADRKTRADQLLAWSIAGVLVALIVFLAVYAGRRNFNPDEFESLHAGWKLLQGEEYVVDFFEHHHPLFYYALADIIGVFGDGAGSLFAARAFVFVQMLVIAALTWLLAGHIFDRRTAMISVVLLLSSFFFYQKAVEIRPDVPMVMCGLLAVLGVFKFISGGRRIWLITSALALAVSFHFLQKAAFTVILIGVILLTCALFKQVRVRDLLLYGVLAALPLAIWVTIMAAQGTLEQFYLTNYTLNWNLLGAFSPRRRQEFLIVNWLLWAAFLVGLPACLATRQRRWLAFLAVCLLLSVYVARAPYRQYYMPRPAACGHHRRPRHDGGPQSAACLAHCRYRDWDGASSLADVPRYGTHQPTAA
jgi:4-amino-4-deoxy-L-arabinose transferase-like glycosyltransferase